MDKFKEGDVVYHKATHKRCVVSGFGEGLVYVTTQDDESRSYKPDELYTQDEYKNRHQNNY